MEIEMIRTKCYSENLKLKKRKSDKRDSRLINIVGFGCLLIVIAGIVFRGW